MDQQSVNSYVPASYFTKDKDQPHGRICHEDFAMISVQNSLSVLMGRGGLFFRTKEILLPKSEQQHLLQALDKNRTAAALWEDRVIILFPELFRETGLCSLLLPYAPAATLAHTLPYLQEEAPLLSPALSELLGHCSASETEACYKMLTEQFWHLRLILHPEKDFDFRLHCAQIARFAGCRVQVTELPVGHFPLPREELNKWTAFLLCCFLTLRGDSAKGPEITLDEAHVKTFHLRLTHHSQRQGKHILKDPRFAFLSLPCFSDWLLTKTDQGFLLQATLRRRSFGILSALSPFGDKFYLEITEAEEQPQA